MSDTVIKEEVVLTDTGDHERFKHIVWDSEPGRAAAMITEAMIEGTPVQALCGKVWVPSRDPERYPVCPECQEIADELKKAFG